LRRLVASRSPGANGIERYSSLDRRYRAIE
jgi:hypothetical protein